MIRDRKGRFAKHEGKSENVKLPVLLGVGLAALYCSFTVSAFEPTPIVVEQYQEVKPRVVLIGTKVEWTPERIKKEYREQAEIHGVSFDRMWSTVMCENPELKPSLQSYWVVDGVREESYGLSQIHLPSWPDVTYEQATDPAFSAEFMAKRFSEGLAHRWTCYRQIYM